MSAKICIHCLQPGSAADEIVLDGNGCLTHETCRRIFRNSVYNQWDFLMLIIKLKDLLAHNPALAKIFEKAPPTESFESYPRCIAAAIPEAEKHGIAHDVIFKLKEIRGVMLELRPS